MLINQGKKIKRMKASYQIFTVIKSTSWLLESKQMIYDRLTKRKLPVNDPHRDNGMIVSTAHRLKTSLRATMKSRRFSLQAILNIYKDITDKHDLKAIENEFMSTRERRFEYFGKFF